MLTMLGQTLIAPLALLAAPALAAAVLTGSGSDPRPATEPSAERPHVSPPALTPPALTPPALTPLARSLPAWTPPVPGPAVGGFDPPQRPWLAGHRGIDLAAEPGDPVRSVADGVVAFAGMVAGRGVVSVQHGQVRSTYEPVTPAAAVGDQVATGERLGRVAGSAHEGCRCLHLGARRGEDYLDPWSLLRPPSRLVSVAAWESPLSRPSPRSVATASE